jgi:hypothetical protein
MARCSPEQSLKQARRIAWVLAAGAVACAAWRLVTGWTPPIHTDSWPRVRDMDFSVIVFMPQIVYVLSVLIGWGIFPLVVGRRWIFNPQATRRITASPLEAKRITESGQASLLTYGFTMGDWQPLPDGTWRSAARQERSSLSGDPRRSRQLVEFMFAGGELAITSRLSGPYVESGEADYQRWLVDALASGASLEAPPRTQMIKPMWVVSSGTLLFVIGLLIQPHQKGSPVPRTEFVASLAMTAAIYLGVAALVWVQRRWTRGANLFIPALVILAAALTLYPGAPHK